MIRIKLKRLRDDKAFKDGRRITLDKVSGKTGIARATFNRIANIPGYNTTTEHLDALCAYFECTPGELLEYVAAKQLATCRARQNAIHLPGSATQPDQSVPD